MLQMDEVREVWNLSERESRKNTIYQLLLNGPKIASAWRGAVFNFLNTMGLNYFWFWFLKSKRYLRCTSQVFTRVNSEFISRSPHKNNQYESWIFEKKFCLFNFWENIYVQKYSRLRCLLRVKGLVIGFYLGWSGHTLLIRKI